MIKNIPSLEEANAFMSNTLISTLGISVTEITESSISASMPVDHRTVQPMGLLHGGASVSLAESLGSFGSSLCIDAKKQAAVGLEVNANHIRSVKTGFVQGKARLIHCGKKTHLWEIKITDSEDRLVCLSKLTVMIIDLR